MDIEKLKLGVQIWEKTVDVQQHFNDLELRIRNFAITILGAVLGAAGLAVKDNLLLHFGGWQTPLASWFILVGLVAWLAFYFMDRWWYHRLLYGAVKHGEKLEKILAVELPGLIGLGMAISDASSFTAFGMKVRTPLKIDVFYGVIAAILIVAMVGLHIALG